MPRPAQIVNALGLKGVTKNVSLGDHVKKNGQYYYHISADAPGDVSSVVSKTRKPISVNYRGHIYKWHLDNVKTNGKRVTFGGHLSYQYTPSKSSKHTATTRRRSVSSRTSTPYYHHRKTKRTTTTPRKTKRTTRTRRV